MRGCAVFLDTVFLKSDEIYLDLFQTIDGNEEKEWLPSYHFNICSLGATKLGKCDLRIGHNEKTYYGGNIGYQIDPDFRGHHYAAKACTLLFELAKLHGMKYLLITCNPDNIASRKTCEYAGGKLEKIVDLPPENDMFIESGETQKAIYRFLL